MMDDGWMDDGYEFHLSPPHAASYFLYCHGHDGSWIWILCLSAPYQHIKSEI